jgi:hypothetical protein
MTRASILGLVFVLACGKDGSGPGGKDPGTDGEQTEPTAPGAAEYAGPPVVDEIVPYVAVSDGFIYVVGSNLTATDGTFADVVVRLVGTDPSGNAVEKLLEITEGFAERLTVHVPPDLHTEVVDGIVRVETPKGNMDAPAPVFVVEDNGFGGATLPGHGMIGTVYALKPNTSALPNLFESPCTEPAVLDNEQFACPHTTILVPNLQVEVLSFENGFPGLGDELVEWFAIAFEGYLEVPESGRYQFDICSDDGSMLFIDRGDGWERLIDNDGLHGMSCMVGPAELDAGRYPVAVHYFQGPRTQIGMTFKWTPPGGTEGYVPQENLWLFPE